MKIDLHLHSSYSFDSTNEVEEILKMAKENNFSYLAICDHNVTKGNIEAKDNDLGIKIISGIEIDCFFHDKIIHVLGLGCNLQDERFEKIRKHYYKELDRIDYERLAIIEKYHNVKLDIDKIRSYSHFDGFSNVEIERVLLEDHHLAELAIYQTGSKKDNPIANYYWDNLSIGKWGYVKMELPDYKDIIDLIHDTNGVAICAHPNVNIDHDLSCINDLIENGIDGFEAYSSYHNEKDISFYQQICDDNDLIYTCGSDYHGSTKPNIKLGDHHYDNDGSIIIEKLKRRINI